MTGVIAAVLCAASGATVYDVTLGETTEKTAEVSTRAEFPIFPVRRVSRSRT
jgi:hypothetical protein